MKHYTVEYKMYSSDEVKEVYVLANSKYDAYTKATYEVIPEKEEELPYSSWVARVTFNNGNTKEFNTFEGNAY